MKRSGTGLTDILLGTGFSVPSRMNGIDTRVTGAALNCCPATITTSCGSLTKLGVASRDASHACPTPTGSVAQRSVASGGAGAKSVAKPSSAKVAGPGGRLPRVNERSPVMGLIGTVLGFTARQQFMPVDDRNTTRYVCRDAGGPLVSAAAPERALVAARLLPVCCHNGRTSRLPVCAASAVPTSAATTVPATVARASPIHRLATQWTDR